MKPALLSFLAFAVALSGMSQSSFSAAIPGNYAVIKAGIYSPQSNDLTSNGADFGTGFNGEIAVGHYFFPNLAGEFGIGWFRTNDSHGGTDITIQTVPITVSLRGVLPLGQFEPYFEAGFGIYKTRATSKTGGVTAANEDTVGGSFIGLGANYNFAPNAFFGLEARYLWVKPWFNIGGLHVDSALDGYTLTADLGYRF